MDVEAMLVAVRGAFATEASSEVRLAGASACRAMLAVLEPAPQQPQLNPAAIATAVSALRGVPPEKLLDLAIAKLRGALPAGVEVSPVAPLKFSMVPFPKGS